MKDFFEDLGKKIGETAEAVTNMAGEAMEIQRIKNQIRSLERSNDRDMVDLGKMLYDRFKEGEMFDTEVMELCDAVQKREEKIAEYEEEAASLKGAVKCTGCQKNVAKDMAYCPFCGTKAPEQTCDAEEKDFAQEMKEEVFSTVKDAGEEVKDAAKDAAETVADAAKHIGEEAKDAAKDVADVVKDSMK